MICSNRVVSMFFFFNGTATTDINTYCHTLSLHDALPIYRLRAPDGTRRGAARGRSDQQRDGPRLRVDDRPAERHRKLGDRPVPLDARDRAVSCRRRQETRSEEHTSELQSLMRISYAVFCLKKKKHN